MAVAEQSWMGWRKSSYSDGSGGNCVEVGWRKSSYSNGSGGECVEVGWQKSSYSDGTGGNCVEVQMSATRVGVRDSKNATGPTLAFPDTSWRTFLHR